MNECRCIQNHLKSFDAMICRHGGLTFVRHNEIRDITAEWLDRICHDVVIEPPLQPLTGENVIPASLLCIDAMR